jgi:Asp-tRNA(Asn)/Glu-tRNA(Gln) amidotransferase A subunit family amidase
MQIVGPPFDDETVFRIAAAHARGPGAELYTQVFPPATESPAAPTD